MSKSKTNMLQAKFDELIEKQRVLAVEFQKEAQALFKETTKEFFANNSDITAVIWTQYTPYFNDGDECVFSIGDVYFTNATNLDEITSWGEYEPDDENVFSVSNPAYIMNNDREYYKKDRAKLRALKNFNADDCELLSKMINSNEMENIMRAMFDNHVRVVATKDGFDVQEFEHE